jgi:ribA/ribD-fused uncharacterized protein
MENNVKYKNITIHNEEFIRGFFEEFRFLSNFHKCPVYFEGLLYPSSENAYQASKLLPNVRFNLQSVSPSQSRTEWQKYQDDLSYSPEEWLDIKYDVMSSIVFDKFYRNVGLRIKLLETGNKYLEETNSWHDVYWGVCGGTGENNLGKILMKVRNYWKIN